MTARVAFLQHSEWDTPGILGERSRELRFTTETFRADRGADALPHPGAIDLLVIMGSAESATNRQLRWIDDERRLVAHAVSAGIPMLGVCFGGQLLAQVLGGEVDRAPRSEIGWRRLDTDDPERIPSGPWVVWHEDAFSAPPGADAAARTEVSLHAYILGVHTGVQFHPEVTWDIVAHWVDDARTDGRITNTEAAELLSGFDGKESGPEDQARRLFDRFVERAGHSI